MRRVLCWPLVTLLTLALTVMMAGCGSESLRHEREARLNVYPDNYKAELLAALHTYVSDPTNIRDANVSEPELRPIGTQNRYSACVRFNARNSDGRYVGSRDVLAIFVAGRFDQFIDSSVGPVSQANQTTFVKEQCGQAEYKRFPELEAMKR